MPLLDIMKFSLAEVQKALNVRAKILNDNDYKDTFVESDIAFTGVSTDTRTIQQDNLFFALTGGNFDGHRFVNEAFAKGAAAAVVKEKYSSGNGLLIPVADTLMALGDLAKCYRDKFDIKCIGITGSNGKTTTKEMTAACLQKKYRTLKTAGNFNNLIGLPLMLFNLDDSHQVAVFELGMSYSGEIARLAQISQPQIGVFTNIAPVHLESMGTIEAVAEAKFELIENLPDNGTVILNADDKFMSTWIKRINQCVITYGIDSKADYRVESIEFATNGIASFSILNTRYQINFPGRHNLYNAVTAIATAENIGCKASDIAEALANLKPYKLRSEVFENAGVIFINDCYNANPSSVKSAIDALAEYPSKGRKIAILADMLELGENEKMYHREIGEYLSLRRIDALFAYGKLGELFIESFGGNFKMHFTDKKQLTSELKDYMRPGDVVLVKGSRGMALEEIGESFRGKD